MVLVSIFHVISHQNHCSGAADGVHREDSNHDVKRESALSCHHLVLLAKYKQRGGRFYGGGEKQMPDQKRNNILAIFPMNKRSRYDVKRKFGTKDNRPCDRRCRRHKH